MSLPEGSLVSKLFYFYIIVMLGIGGFIYLNPVSKKATLF